MIDIVTQLAATIRRVAAETDSDTVAVRLSRRYDADPAEVWDALTDPERLRRWFLPISGDLRAGGTFELEGNASGDILDCEPPTRLRVTFGGPTSIVEVTLTAAGAETVLDLLHTVPLAMAGSAAGSLYVGPGWDGALLGLALYFAGEVADDPVAAANSLEAQEFSRGSIDAWTAVTEGAASTEEITAARGAALAQFCPDLPQS
ncbi:SRPBCC family protein [Actinokineospora sp. NBRC 105648]|uniref:SRPBCC family protein n=1 Tax=Actinokineospora sp. NBRC 105648 TaxID=3032206 RepID=UPI0024A0B98B|nr:SRPBCC family protein [Actinokineospora sp. NBRC 105648]GLZ38860.1 activator of HSP90 ATPase [Actinokineospora sp. NBRC 105648]